jgi:5-dehydro-2-deoxygluconokinase
VSRFTDRIGAAPISWGICEAPGWGMQLPVERVLREARSLGITAMEQGALGWLPTDPTAQRAVLDSYGISLIGGFVPLVLHDPAARPTTMARAQHVAADMTAAGGTMFVTAIVGSLDDWFRPEMTAAMWDELFANLVEVDRIVREHGLVQAVHPHVDTLIETAAEFERFLNGCDIGFCFDTGHLAIGGADVVAIARDHSERVAIVHLKDVDMAVAARIGDLGLMGATQAGLFPPLGDGDVALDAVVRELESSGYDGWYVMETDVSITDTVPPEGEGPAVGVARSLAHARSLDPQRNRPLELLTVGRISVDLYAEQLHRPVRTVETYRKSVGGTATNVAVACARLGHRSAVFTRVGNDPFGDYVRWALDHTFGVDTSYIRIDPALRTPLAFASMEDPAEPVLDFYRVPHAPDMMIRPSDIDSDVVTNVAILWFPASCLSGEQSRSTILQLLHWRQRAEHTILDLDWRPQFWPSPDAAGAAIRHVLAHVTMAIGNRTECEIAVGESDPDRAADALLAHGLTAVVVKLGGDGVLVAAADGFRQRIAPYPVDVVCGLGAGDAFGGAFCHGLLSGWDLARCAQAGNAAGAIVASRLMCADDMPYRKDIDALVDR